MPVNWKKSQQKALRTARWAVTMTKVRIRRITAATRWQLVVFYGKSGGESVGIVDLLAVRKDHRKPRGALDRGDALQIILIQVKGGAAAMPTAKDWMRLRAVAKRHCAMETLLAVWKKGRTVRFYRPLAKTTGGRLGWAEVEDPRKIFR